MSDPYVGEIRMFGGNFGPAQWALCNGQLMAISQNEALFSLIGTTYGGDGQATFGLPDFRGRVPIHMGQGQGLSVYSIGQLAGTEQVALTAQNLPTHRHSLVASLDTGSQPSPSNAFAAVASTGNVYFPAAGPAAMSASAVAATGGNIPHDNLMPFVCVSFIISLFGIFPTRN